VTVTCAFIHCHRCCPFSSGSLVRKEIEKKNLPMAQETSTTSLGPHPPASAPFSLFFLSFVVVVIPFVVPVVV
jgi:hypothetical protein